MMENRINLKQPLNPFFAPYNNYYQKLFTLSDNLYKFALRLKPFTSWLI